MQLDATPFDSDFDDIFKLFDAMRVFAKANPEHEFLPTDDPGANHETVSYTHLSSTTPSARSATTKRVSDGTPS